MSVSLNRAEYHSTVSRKNNHLKIKKIPKPPSNCPLAGFSPKKLHFITISIFCSKNCMFIQIKKNVSPAWQKLRRPRVRKVFGVF